MSTRDKVVLEELPELAPTLPEPSATRGKSLFSQQKKDKTTLQAEDNQRARAALERPHPADFISVLSDIVERPTSAIKAPVAKAATGFPEVVHRSRFQRSSRPIKEPPVTERRTRDTGNNTGGAGDDIHQENMQKLAEMSEEEIREAQEQLMRTLPPALVERLKKIDREKEAARRGQAPLSAPVRSSTAASASVESKPDVIMEEAASKNSARTEEEGDLEEHKLEWTQDVVPGENKYGQDKSNVHPVMAVRFDFNGEIAKDTKGDSSALYHHGDEPDQPGYSIPEVLQLVRSAMPGQRTINLQLLAAILRTCAIRREQVLAVAPEASGNAAAGQVFKWSDLPFILLERDILLYLRLALDDKNTTVMTEGLEALKALMLAVMSVRSGSHFTPALFTLPSRSCAPSYRARFQVPLKSFLVVPGGIILPDDPEKKYEDLVIALVNAMSILPRLRYILEVCKVSAAVPAALDILTLIASHSMGMAASVGSCPRLADTLKVCFLEQQAAPVPIPYEHIFPQALLTIFVTCASSRSATDSFVKAGLIPSLGRLLAPLPQLSKGETSKKCLEYAARADVFSAALGVLEVCIGYGIRCEDFVDYFPSICMHSTLPAAVLVPGTVDPAVRASYVALAGAVYSFYETYARSASVGAAGSLWSYAAALVKPAQEFIATITSVEQSLTDSLIMKCVGASLSFLATFYDRAVLAGASSIAKANDSAGDAPPMAAMEVLENIESFIDGCFVAHWKRVATPSVLQMTHGAGAEGQSHLECYVNGVLRCMVVMGRVHKGSIERIISRHPPLRDDVTTLIVSGLPRLGQVPGSAVGVLMSRQAAVQLRYHAVLLADMLVPDGSVATGNASLVGALFECAMHLLTQLVPGDEYMVKELFNQVLFRDKYTQPILDGARGPYEQYLGSTHQMIRGCLPVYLAQLCTKKGSQRSDELSLRADAGGYGNVLASCESMMIPQGQSRLPALTDWYYNPVFTHGGGKELDLRVEQMRGCLDYATHVSKTVPACGSPAVNPAWHMYSIMRVFNHGPSYYEDKAMGVLLGLQLDMVGGDSSVLDFESGAVPDFFTFFQSFVDGYMSESFGNTIYTRYVRYFLRMSFPEKYRKLLWHDARQYLHNLAGTPPADPTPFLFPLELEDTVINEYIEAVREGAVTPERGGWLYWVAIHHICGAAFGPMGLVAPMVLAPPLLPADYTSSSAVTADECDLVLHKLRHRPVAVDHVKRYMYMGPEGFKAGHCVGDIGAERQELINAAR